METTRRLVEAGSQDAVHDTVQSAKLLPDLPTVICRVVGGLLLVSALLKATSPGETAVLATAYDMPSWISFATVQFEVLLAFLLFSGIASTVVLPVTLFTFLCFAGFSLFRALAGFESCGCFGALSVNPWVTLVLDILVVAAVGWSARARREAEHTEGRTSWLPAAATYLAFGGSLWIIMWITQPKVLTAGEGTSRDNQLMILEPETWIGKAFPLSDEISPAVNVNAGSWTILMYHHDCPKCQEALPAYEALANQWQTTGQPEQVLLIEVPPFGHADAASGNAIHARLSDRREWFVQAPVEIGVRDGRVYRASHDLPSIQ